MLYVTLMKTTESQLNNLFGCKQIGTTSETLQSKQNLSIIQEVNLNSILIPSILFTKLFITKLVVQFVVSNYFTVIRHLSLCNFSVLLLSVNRYRNVSENVKISFKPA